MKSTEQLIVDHPLAAVGGAFAIGLLTGWSGGRDRGRIARAVVGALSGIVVTIVRDNVLDKLGSYAKSWIDEPDRARATSYEPEVETFFEH